MHEPIKRNAKPRRRKTGERITSLHPPMGSVKDAGRFRDARCDVDSSRGRNNQQGMISNTNAHAEISG
jgi:hypothetical protein